MRKNLLLGCAAMVLASALGGCASSGNDFIYQALAKADKGWSALPDYDRGKRYLQVGDYGLAIEAFELELRRDPASVRSLNGAAIAYQRIGRDDVAEKLLGRALQIEPNSTFTLNNMAFLYMTHGDRAGALAMIERAKAAPADNATVASVLKGNETLLVPQPIAQLDGEPMLAAAPTVPVTAAPLEAPAVAAAPKAPAPQLVLDMPAPLVPAPELPPRVEIASPKATAPVRQPLIEAPQSIRIASAKIDISAPQPVLDLAEPAAVASRLTATIEPPRPAITGNLLATLSVVNGSGRSRQAHRIGQFLTSQGFRVERLTNASSFGRRQTLLFCHPASRQNAEAIARSMPIAVKVVELKSGSDRIELVAGRDLDAFDGQMAALKLAQR
jgi:hypothetical protein